MPFEMTRYIIFRGRDQLNIWYMKIDLHYRCLHYAQIGLN